MILAGVLAYNVFSPKNSFFKKVSFRIFLVLEDLMVNNQRTKDLLFLFDWDGVVVKPDEKSFSIMREALFDVLRDSSGLPRDVLEERLGELSWPKIFDRTKGTTEPFLVKAVIEELGCLGIQDSIFARFVQRRAQLIENFNRERGLVNFDDGNIFSDAYELLASLKKKENAVIGLVTGNPSLVVESRLPNKIRDFFDFWVGGDFGGSRRDLVEEALRRARQEYGWKDVFKAGPEKREVTNAYYLDDSLRAVVDVLGGTACQVIHVLRREGSNLGLSFGQFLYGEAIKMMREEGVEAGLALRWLMGASESPRLMVATSIFPEKFACYPAGNFINPETHRLWCLQTAERISFISRGKEGPPFLK